MINITFPDGNIKQFEDGVTPFQVAESISAGLARNILAATLNDEEWDISRPITHDGAIKFFKWEDEEGKHAFWHTSAHLLAEALQELYKGVQFGIGPAIENGFYYDIDPGENTLTSADFPKIEKKMLELVARKEEVVRRDISNSSSLAMQDKLSSANSSTNSKTATSLHIHRATSPTFAVVRTSPPQRPSRP